MNKLNWDKHLDVGIEKFNIQHRRLFALLGKIYSSMENKQDRKTLALIINELIDYSKIHLTEEETCLLLYDYPDYEEHRKQHKIFIEKIEQFVADFKSEKPLIHCDMAVFLKSWIVNHINNVDKKYTEFLHSKGVK